MYHFLLSNKKYKYEEFFIDEYKELEDFLCYIEEKILSVIKRVEERIIYFFPKV